MSCNCFGCFLVGGSGEEATMRTTLLDSTRLLWLAYYQTETGKPRQDMFVFIHGSTVKWRKETSQRQSNAIECEVSSEPI